MSLNLIYWIPICGSYFLKGSILEKMWKNMEKLLFFRTATAGLGKYSMGSYGWIGVNRVRLLQYRKNDIPAINYTPTCVSTFCGRFHFLTLSATEGGKKVFYNTP